MVSSSGKRSTKNSAKKPYQPFPGREIEVDEVPLVEAKTRGFLVRLIAIATLLAVGITGFYGLFTGAYRALEVVWSVAGPFMGAMVAYYFGSHRKDSG
jgi:hypothetical protein